MYVIIVFYRKLGMLAYAQIFFLLIFKIGWKMFTPLNLDKNISSTVEVKCVVKIKTIFTAILSLF